MRKDVIKYVMFDFDGTIVDSMPFLENNAVYLLTNQYDFSEEEAQKIYRETTGLPFLQQMEIIAPGEDNSQIINKFEKMKIERIYEQKLFADSYKVLEELKELEYLLGISSGTIEAIIVKYLYKQGLTIVDDILGWRPGFEKGKDHFNFVKSKYKLSSSNIAFIGDSLNDARRAKAENIFFIGKEGMFQTKHFQKIIRETPVISSLKEVKEILETCENEK
ncbi:MAG: HAD family hydrolase [Candidatus Heimdallarchaeota archaeon]|nr:MAG: HAD family hydrolase [Candidatus Heimdallarchaeota archaeon]